MKMHKLSIGVPVKEKVYSYAKHSMRNVTLDECRKYLVVRYQARTLDRESAEETMADIIAGFSSLGCAIKRLGSFSWGEPASFDEVKGIFKGAFCIPIDADDMSGQRQQVADLCLRYEEQMNLGVIGI